MKHQAGMRLIMSVGLMVLAMGCSHVSSKIKGGQTPNLSGTYKGVFRPEADNELMRLELRQVGSKIDGVMLYYGEKRKTDWKKPQETIKMTGEISEGTLWLAGGVQPGFLALRLKPKPTGLSGVLADTAPSQIDIDHNGMFDVKEFSGFFEKASLLVPMEFEKE